MTNETLRIISFRVECQYDLEVITRQFKDNHITYRVSQLHHDPNGLPDIDVEMRVSTSLVKLLRLFEQLPNLHMAMDTLRECPLAENSLKRF